MPSHIFTGRPWQESIKSNTAAEVANKEYAAKNLPGQTLWLRQQDSRIHALPLEVHEPAAALVEFESIILGRS